MSTDGQAWESLFKDRAHRLIAGGSATEIGPMEEGVIAYQDERKCTNCSHQGVYSGIGLFYGHLFRAVNADYCPNCSYVRKISTSIPLISSNPKNFLPVVEKRLVNYPSLVSETTADGPCPTCGVEARVLEVARGAINSFGHRWTVCAIGCGWPGLYEPIIE